MICANCPHDLKDHCKGGVVHGNYKEEARMVPIGWRRPSSPCISRHCQATLCCCLDFVEPEEAKP